MATINNLDTFKQLATGVVKDTSRAGATVEAREQGTLQRAYADLSIWERGQAAQFIQSTGNKELGRVLEHLQSMSSKNNQIYR